MKFRKKPVVIEATQWFKNGDHPQDNPKVRMDDPHPTCGEGKVIRYYRHPDVSGRALCKHCNQIMHAHGWIDTLEGGNDGAQVVCPGDWIITGVAGEIYPCKPSIFDATYEAVA